MDINEARGNETRRRDRSDAKHHILPGVYAGRYYTDWKKENAPVVKASTVMIDLWKDNVFGICYKEDDPELFKNSIQEFNALQAEYSAYAHRVGFGIYM